MPKAPNTTFAIERFIAAPIIRVSIMPEAPTSAPEMIRALLCSTKPVAAAARPVNEFSSEITTGMSAPPIAITMITPSSSDSTMASASTPSLWLPTYCEAARPSTARNSTAFTSFWPGIVTGLPVISSCSLPNATIDPAKLTDPTIAENSVDVTASLASDRLEEVAMWYSLNAISAAAPPPTPLNSATICGIAVILTARAE